MNLDANPTKEQLRELLAACDDLAGHHALWVSRQGDVRITLFPRGWPPPKFNPSPNVQLWHETFPGGMEYVGEKAVANEEWIPELFDALMEQWQKAKGQQRAVSFHLFDGIRGS
jgi:hypothetical protein